MNEGWATFWHYTILNRLYDKGLVTDGFMIEFLQSHTAVTYQPPFDSPWYSGINPYTLGFAMYQDIRRICEEPTEEDKQWFPDIAGSDWLTTIHFAMENFKDESFILQFLSPKVIRDLKLFSIMDDDMENEYHIKAIHDENGYQIVREQLARQYNLSYREPNIQVWNVDIRGDRSLTLRHIPVDRVPMESDTDDVLKHIHRLWGSISILKALFTTRKMEIKWSTIIIAHHLKTRSPQRTTAKFIACPAALRSPRFSAEQLFQDALNQPEFWPSHLAPGVHARQYHQAPP